MNEPGKKIINIGFIGCGKISEKHFSALKEHIREGSNIKVAAVCDINPERSKKAAESLGAKAYIDIDEMLQKEKLDIVTIATPNGLHPAHIKKVADYKIDIITDKPIATTFKEGEEVVNYCEKQNVRLFVVHQVRFNDSMQIIKQAIDEGRFGKIYFIASRVFWTRPQSYYDEVPWHGTKEMDGGAFLTQASHFVDLMQWFADSKPNSISAILKTLGRKIETEDTGSAILDWQNGIIGTIDVTMLSYQKNYEGSITILGENGTVKVGGRGMNEIEDWQFSDSKPYDKDILNKSFKGVSSFTPGHTRFYEDVIDSINKDRNPLISGVEGLKSLELLQAIYDSNDSKAPINFK